MTKFAKPVTAVLTILTLAFGTPAIGQTNSFVRVVLPGNIDPTGLPRTVQRGTRVYVDRAPITEVSYQSLENGQNTAVSESLRDVVNVARTGRGTFVMFRNGSYKWFPADAKVVPNVKHFAAYFAAPGMRGLPGRTPDYVVP
jgi:hypothetical protein